VKILFNSINFPPDRIGIAKYSGDMVSWLTARGHTVRVVTAPPYYPDWSIPSGYSGWRYRVEQRPEGRVLRCPLWVRPGMSGGKRLLHLASFAAASAPVMVAAAIAWRPDLIFVTAPALMTLPASLVGARLSGARLWLHVHDFEIDAAFNLGMLAGGASRRLALGVERGVMTRCDRVSTLTAPMRARLHARGLTPDRTSLLPNWVDGSVLYPLSGPSPMRAELGFGDDDVVALYSGNMGNKQGLETIIEAARLLSGEPRIRFVLVGGGSHRETLLRMANGLANVSFLPLVADDRFNDLLNLGDIHLLPQRAGAADLVMPSKLAGCMASGRPVVAGALPGTEIAEVLRGGGILVPPDDAAAFAAAIGELAVDPARRQTLGEWARAQACALWGRQGVLEAFEREALALVGAAPLPVAALERAR
jgi:colanic acid biosynthesis glycosyl transferase WcaI